MTEVHNEPTDAPRADLLRDAHDLTMGDRNEAYGEPVANHRHIADIFNAITGRDLSAREIALVHQATKLARRAKNPLHRDSYLDGTAYAGIEYECALDEATPRHRVDAAGQDVASGPSASQTLAGVDFSQVG